METTILTKKDSIRQELISSIKNGQYVVDNKLEGERQLALQLGVSRGTLRQVVDELVQEGLLVRKHGSGTYINKNLLNNRNDRYSGNVIIS